MTRRRPPFFALLAASLLGCPGKTQVEKVPPVANAEPAMAVAPSASAERPPVARAFTTLLAEPFAPGGAKPGALYAVEGGIAVTEGIRVGMVTGEEITWVGKIPEGSAALGPNTITAVRGRWPDLLAAIYVSGMGRAPQPTYFPLTGKAGSFTVAEGGGFGDMNGVARVGETVFLAIDSLMSGPQLVPVRGPKLVRHVLTPAEAGCKEGEVGPLGMHPQPAIVPRVLESSPAGTILSLGSLCQKRGPAAEIWDKDGKTRIIDVSRWWKAMTWRATILKGEGDELWAYSDEWSPVVLHYKDGEITPLPELGWPIQQIFVSSRGRLHASDGRVVHRFEGGKWTPLARLPETPVFHTLAVDDKDTLWASGPGVYRLRPGPATPAPETCPTPFVYLFPVSSKNGKTFTYPATRKALSTFPEASALGLVELGPEYDRRVGVTTATRAQAEALIVHLKAAMPDEDPRFFCVAPRDPRQIPLDAGP